MCEILLYIKHFYTGLSVDLSVKYYTVSTFSKAHYIHIILYKICMCCVYVVWKTKYIVLIGISKFMYRVLFHQFSFVWICDRYRYLFTLITKITKCLGVFANQVMWREVFKMWRSGFYYTWFHHVPTNNPTTHLVTWFHHVPTYKPTTHLVTWSAYRIAWYYSRIPKVRDKNSERICTARTLL